MVRGQVCPGALKPKELRIGENAYMVQPDRTPRAGCREKRLPANSRVGHEPIQRAAATACDVVALHTNPASFAVDWNAYSLDPVVGGKYSPAIIFFRRLMLSELGQHHPVANG